ncbi:hypothetical protein [Amycolatopsis echigonensis]|nr:hypothetical protein [Amycolatopsis echigonensis]
MRRGGLRDRFRVETAFLDRELWVPPGELGEFNTHLVGKIEVVHEFR